MPNADSPPMPPRKWRTGAVRNAIQTLGAVGALVAATPATMTAHSGPTRGVVELSCRGNAHNVESVVVDLMNRRLIPMTGKNGDGCVASVPFQLGRSGMPDLVDPNGNKFQSDRKVLDLLFEQRNLRELYEAFVPVAQRESADSARHARNALEPSDVWEVMERDHERQAAVSLSAVESQQFLGQLRVMHRMESNLRTDKAKQSGGQGNLLDQIVRNTERQLNSRARSTASAVVSHGLRKIF